jgi:predicted nucleic acid-binding protein
MSRPVLLDSSFLIAIDRETATSEKGPAKAFLPRLLGRKIVISVVTAKEVLEGAAEEGEAMRSLQRFAIQGIHLAHAQKCAGLERRASRRMGENDAWIVATAVSLDADVVGADRRAFERLGDRYLRFR